MLENMTYSSQSVWGALFEMPQQFFVERADQSQVKALIVSQYFDIWSKIIAPNTMRSDGKLAYIDLFAGPGRYEDGSASTPLMVLSKAVVNAKVSAGLVSMFNDKDTNHTKTLRAEIAAMPGKSNLKHEPQIYEGEVGRPIADYFESVRLVPTFSFIDPFGYKGLSWALIRSVIKDWGCDCVFFFNYSRINAGINNPIVDQHMEALFGKENLEHLRATLNTSQANREGVIVEHLKSAMIDAGAKYVQMFRFRNENNTRTTHYLVFVTKHPTGYELMKEIMATHSSHADQGVPSYEYAPSMEGTIKLFEDARDQLEDRLVAEFAGQTLTMVALYHRDNIEKPFVKKNYKEALSNLLAAKRVVTDRVPRFGTFADGVVVTFPIKPVGRT
jgi:three-Cys-motif partner protein